MINLYLRLDQGRVDTEYLILPYYKDIYLLIKLLSILNDSIQAS
jgi:hypothetical protein